jgi:hypothetical protein
MLNESMQCRPYQLPTAITMKTASIDEASKVMELQARGKTEHDSGGHAAPEANPGKAQKMLNK